jgi:hypothetical protein
MTGQGLLFGRTEDEFTHLAGLEACGQIIERPMPLAPSAAAIGLATGGEALDERSSKQVRGDLQGTKQPLPALAQREGWLAAEIEYLSQ